MINVTAETFETEVLVASTETPVLVDFWATWCGPCRTLGPILEKLETEYDGRFKLVKIDCDQEQQLAGAFGVRSIPTCVLLKDGQPVDGFQGALPEGAVRQFLDRHVPSEGAIAAEAEADEAEGLLEAGDAAAAIAKMATALLQDPANDELRAAYAQLLIVEDRLDEAGEALAEPLAREPLPLRFEALGRWLDAAHFVLQDERGQWTEAQFQERINANKRDFDTRFARARKLMADGDFVAAMDELLEIIMRDKKWNDEAARKTYVAILELMTPPPAKAGAGAGGEKKDAIQLTGKAAMEEDPQAELLSSYRRKLSMALN